MNTESFTDLIAEQLKAWEQVKKSEKKLSDEPKLAVQEKQKVSLPQFQFDIDQLIKGAAEKRLAYWLMLHESEKGKKLDKTGKEVLEKSIKQTLKVKHGAEAFLMLYAQKLTVSCLDTIMDLYQIQESLTDNSLQIYADDITAIKDKGKQALVNEFKGLRAKLQEQVNQLDLMKIVVPTILNKCELVQALSKSGCSKKCMGIYTSLSDRVISKDMTAVFSNIQINNAFEPWELSHRLNQWLSEIKINLIPLEQGNYRFLNKGTKEVKLINDNQKKMAIYILNKEISDLAKDKAVKKDYEKALAFLSTYAILEECMIPIGAIDMDLDDVKYSMSVLEDYQAQWTKHGEKLPQGILNDLSAPTEVCRGQLLTGLKKEYGVELVNMVADYLTKQVKPIQWPVETPMHWDGVLLEAYDKCKGYVDEPTWKNYEEKIIKKVGVYIKNQADNHMNKAIQSVNMSSHQNKGLMATSGEKKLFYKLINTGIDGLSDYPVLLNSSLPQRQIVDCWQEKLDRSDNIIETFLMINKKMPTQKNSENAHSFLLQIMQSFNSVMDIKRLKEKERLNNIKAWSEVFTGYGVRLDQEKVKNNFQKYNLLNEFSSDESIVYKALSSLAFLTSKNKKEKRKDDDVYGCNYTDLIEKSSLIFTNSVLEKSSENPWLLLQTEYFKLYDNFVENIEDNALLVSIDNLWALKESKANVYQKALNTANQTLEMFMIKEVEKRMDFQDKELFVEDFWKEYCASEAKKESFYKNYFKLLPILEKKLKEPISFTDHVIALLKILPDLTKTSHNEHAIEYLFENEVENEVEGGQKILNVLYFLASNVDQLNKQNINAFKGVVDELKIFVKILEKSSTLHNYCYPSDVKALMKPYVEQLNSFDQLIKMGHMLNQSGALSKNKTVPRL